MRGGLVLESFWSPMKYLVANWSTSLKVSADRIRSKEQCFAAQPRSNCLKHGLMRCARATAGSSLDKYPLTILLSGEIGCDQPRVECSANVQGHLSQNP
jgi:hypothetical protein